MNSEKIPMLTNPLLEHWSTRFCKNRDYQLSMDRIRSIASYGLMGLGGMGAIAAAVGTFVAPAIAVKIFYSGGFPFTVLFAGYGRMLSLTVRDRPDLTRVREAQIALSAMSQLTLEGFVNIQDQLASHPFKIKELEQSGLIEEKTAQRLDALFQTFFGVNLEDNSLGWEMDRRREQFYDIWMKTVVAKSPLSHVVNEQSFRTEDV